MVSRDSFKNPQILAALDSAASVSDAEDLLNDFAAELVKVYQASPDGRPLVDAIEEDWYLFTDVDAALAVLNVWLSDSTINPNGLKIGDFVSYNDDILSVNATWETLKDEIKNRRRFNIDTKLLDDLEWRSFLGDAIHPIDANRQLYRARMLGDKKDLYSQG